MRSPLRASVRPPAASRAQPENMANRETAQEQDGRAVATSRARLMAALSAGARDKAPIQAANAQVMFDCWMQEQEENFQPDRHCALPRRVHASPVGQSRGGGQAGADGQGARARAQEGPRTPGAQEGDGDSSSSTSRSTARRSRPIPSGSSPRRSTR